MSKGELIAVPRGDKVIIKSSDHPHDGEHGFLTTRTIASTGQTILELEDCKHGVTEAAVLPNEIKSVYTATQTINYDIKELKEKPKNLGGRPTKFTKELAWDICEQIVEGKSLRKILAGDDMPALSTVFRWLDEDPWFQEQYTRAKDNQADTNAEDIQELVEDVRAGKIDPQSARVAGDLLKWTASKLKPKKYGDKVDVTTNGKDLPTPILGTVVQEIHQPEQNVIDLE